MSTIPSGFARPQLTVVVAEDNPEFQQELVELIRADLSRWGLLKTGQFEVEYHCCRSVQRFKETTQQALDAGRIVYATLDLHMPMMERDEGDSEFAGREMVSWCLNREKEMPRASEDLEFCVISGHGDALDNLNASEELRPRLRKRGMKMVLKRARTEAGSDPSLGDILPDLRDFVLKHLRFCTFPGQGGTGLRSERTGDESPPVESIWFPTHESPSRLLVLADKISQSKDGGFYLVFSDVDGYEEDWYQLCCALRGVSPEVLDFRNIPKRFDWESYFRNPPEAILIRGMDHLEMKNLGGGVLRALKQHRFPDLVREKKRLAFVQFPFFETDLDAWNVRLDAGEREILKVCLEDVYKGGWPFPKGIGFAFEEREPIIAFPDYEKVLKREGVLRSTIDYESFMQQQTYGLRGVPLDPEVAEVLSEIAWNEEGFDTLHTTIAVSYAHAKGRAGSSLPTCVMLEDFPLSGPVREVFDSALGFQVRGRRFFRLLQMNDREGQLHAAPLASQSPGAQALATLEVILDVFSGLGKLMELQEKLEKTPGSLQFGPMFGSKQFEALRNAHDFLKAVFETPKLLSDQIDNFHPHAHDEHWKQEFPGLRQHKGWSLLLERIRFTWPFDQLPLHWAVYQYLIDSDVSYEILTAPKKVLDRNPDLSGQWDLLEADRGKLLDQLHDREEQRRRAATFVRKCTAQPIGTLLVNLDEDGTRGCPWTALMQSLVFFNTYLCINEDHHVFEGKFTSAGEVKSVLGQVELGPCLIVLCDYVDRLKKKGRLGESVLSRWIDDWAQQGEQSDAIRRTTTLADRILSDLGHGLTPSERRPMEQLRSRIAVGEHKDEVRHLLDFFRIVRNSYDKPTQPMFWHRYGLDFFELVRRFVAATTRSDLHFGAVAEDGRRILLWTRQGLRGHSLPENGTFKPHETWVLQREGDRLAPIFPLECIRLRISDHSVWSYYKDRWANLTDSAGSEEGRLLVTAPWLPTQDELKLSPLWRKAHGS